MIRNLATALAAGALVMVVGWFAGQPSAHREMAGHPGARYAVLGLIVVLALLALVSLVRAFRPAKKPARPSSPYAAGRK